MNNTKKAIVLGLAFTVLGFGAPTHGHYRPATIGPPPPSKAYDVYAFDTRGIRAGLERLLKHLGKGQKTLVLLPARAWPECRNRPGYVECVKETSEWTCELRRPEPPPSSRNGWHWSCRDGDGEERYVGTRPLWEADICEPLLKCGPIP